MDQTDEFAASLMIVRQTAKLIIYNTEEYPFIITMITQVSSSTNIRAATDTPPTT